ncbi:hypothetical protein NX02_02345 [Sphingomonas sanxanigenens DSM 19645 = NX02]|uniref:Uncharacterized protein n=1 Tax=Sphingomonas sanxanigenens DSM 19645 = NX02 TaxID=1123269 RepID=W0A976_9SPHN|nr:hypothetical protein NX02_02345 [Sphingomonas sanxanigenens DSM 19645 = NX02]
MVHAHALALQHDADPAIAEPTALPCDLPHGFADRSVVRRAFAPDRLGIDANQHAGPTL